MARASFFLTRTDVDSIRQRQLKNGLSLVFLVLVDAGVASLMFFTRERRVRAFVPEVTHLSSAATFKGGTGDLLALVALRASLYACAGALAVTLGKQRNKGPPPPTPPPRSRVGSQAAFLDTAGGSSSDLRAPLLAEDPAPAVSDASDADIVAGVCVDDAPGASDDFDPSAYAPSPEDQLYNQRAVRRRDVIVELTFRAPSPSVRRRHLWRCRRSTHAHRRPFGVVIVCVNARAFTRAECRVGCHRVLRALPALVISRHVVGTCRHSSGWWRSGVCVGGFRCKTCDFDCCMRCFSRKNRDTAEGGVRGDKGSKAHEERTPAEYLWRVLALAKLEWQLLTLAILTTLVTSAAALFVPHFQGAAFDAAIAADRRTFDETLAKLLIASVGVSTFSAFKRACFSLVGQRLNYKVRTGLLKNILRQDIAYFDGVNTGDLLSRLSYDCTNLTAPCNTVMSLAAQNLVVILGGLVMCFLVCWRLAMVSFAVVMPITFLIKRYARWSQTLNREISAMLGLASNAANEALGNIRTVRASSTEHMEFAKYDEHARAALRAGVKDAFGGAFTVA